MGLSDQQVKLAQTAWDAFKSKGDLETHGAAVLER